ncbi:dTDP-glucose 4,6-dehydratase [Micromonospora sp. DR5-3]|uniref:dTDP-glucose 4,6-dehydratase n=1 Tax=unclassified Micromonospora TaxID=2617518 RepID=UPI0011D9196D|nr:MULTISPECIES: dTDP-glucose 4,6-dehydratase [unclassified Micromonospora]MCW3818312.1 dTDP-glucose 4,6-dehydratase [Micromonospora sp. DR5-3]TYC21187.1 dTDP-glucose 4,6-dehydratase [Micromonospora sp. MP36]
MRILVTGGAGFIGSHFVRSILRGAYPHVDCCGITVVDKLTYCGNRNNLAVVSDDPRLRFVHGDIGDAELIDTVLPGHDAVVHFAAETHVDRSISGGAAFVTTNVLGTQVLLDRAVRHGIGRFVHVSTDEVYGSIDEGSWDESFPLAPRSPYSAAKAGSDLLALAYHHTHGLPVLVTRCSNNYGPYQFPEKVVPLFLTNLLDGLPVPLYGDGGNVRDWLHVDDHCRGVALVLTGGRPGEVYHIGGGEELTNRELTERLLEVCGAGWDRVRVVPDRLGHDRRYSLDHGKISAELGYTPRLTFAEGLAETYAWYRDNRAWWEPLRQRAALPRTSA